MRYLIFVFFPLLSGCFLGDNQPDCVEHYMFDIPISVMPNNSEIKLGDTLQISMYTDNSQIYDTFGERSVNFPNFDPNITFMLSILDSLPAKDGLILNDVLINNDIYDVVHQPIQSVTSGLFWLEIDATEFYSKIDFSIVFRTAGTYALYSYSSMYLNQDNICFPNKCRGCGKSSGTIRGVVNFENEDNSEILTDENINIEDVLWEGRNGTWLLTDSYYFKVSK